MWAAFVGLDYSLRFVSLGADVLLHLTLLLHTSSLTLVIALAFGTLVQLPSFAWQMQSIIAFGARCLRNTLACIHDLSRRTEAALKSI